MKKVGEECTKDEECKGKGCCDKGKCEKGNKKVCKNKGKKSHSKPQISKKKSHPLPPSLKKTPAPIIDEELYKDGEDCKIDDHCKSKCCKNNQCVSGSICKDEKKNKKIKKKLIKKDLEKKERLKKYELFEKKSIGYIKDLTGQINRRDEFGKPHRTKKQMMKAYRKLYGKIKDVFNDRFAGHSQGWIIDQIPIEIKRQLDFLKERIIMDKSPSIRNPTPIPPTPSPEPSQSPQTLFNKWYVKLMDSSPSEDLLDDIIAKYNIQFDFQTPPNNYQKMIAITENYKAIHDNRIQDHMNGITDSLKRDIIRVQRAELDALMAKEKEQTFSQEEIRGKKNKSKTPLVKSLTPSKSKSPKKSPKKSHKKILDDLKNNKLNQEEMDKILKNLNLKTQKEYLKELIIIGLDKI